MTLDMPTEAPDTAQIDRLVADLAHAKAAVGRRIFGQDRVIELALTALLAGGHALLIGVPGVAKTRLVGTIGAYMVVARKVDRPAALLMAPYLGWCGFAALLNEEIVRLNP